MDAQYREIVDSYKQMAREMGRSAATCAAYENHTPLVAQSIVDHLTVSLIPADDTRVGQRVQLLTSVGRMGFPGAKGIVQSEDSRTGFVLVELDTGGFVNAAPHLVESID